MPADRTLHNLSRERLLGLYEDLQTEPSSKKYNLRKELQTDKRDNVVYANRWLTRDQFLEMARQEIEARGLEVPAPAPDERGGIAAGGAAAPVAATSGDGAAAAEAAPQAPEAGVTEGAVAEGIVGTGGTAES